MKYKLMLLSDLIVLSLSSSLKVTKAEVGVGLCEEELVTVLERTLNSFLEV